MSAPVIEVSRRLEDVAPDWDALADRCAAPPWLRPAWHESWWRAFGRGSLVVLTARREAGLVGVLPLHRAGRHLRSTSNYHTPAFGLLAEDDHARRALATRACAESGVRVTISFLPEGDPGAAALTSAAARVRRPAIVRVLERSPVVDTRADWAEYERARRGHLVRELRRRRRRLAERGKLEFSIEDGGPRLDGLLDEGFAVEASGWKGERRTAIGSSPATRGFYRTVGHWAASQGWLRLAFLRVDGRAIAFDFAIEADRVHYLLKTGYDPSYRAYAPGMLIRQEMLRRAFAGSVERYEFLGHDDPWKLEWADATTNQVVVQVFPRSPIGLIEWAAFRYGRQLAKRVLGKRR